MKNVSTIRRIRTIVTGPLLAGGILLGSMGIADIAVAVVQPGDMAQCSSMTMANAQGGANPSPMTRAGQINAAGINNAADTGMPLNCQPVNHG
jgi:hypothetical protein